MNTKLSALIAFFVTVTLLTSTAQGVARVPEQTKGATQFQSLGQKTQAKSKSTSKRGKRSVKPHAGKPGKKVPKRN